MESHPGDTLGTRFLTFWGAILAFFGFAVFAMLLQKCSSGMPVDPKDAVREANLAEISAEGASELEKLGWDGDHTEALQAAVASVRVRKQSETKVAVPGTPAVAQASSPPAEPAESGVKEVDDNSEEGVKPDSEPEKSTEPTAPEPTAPEPTAPEPTAPEPTAAPEAPAPEPTETGAATAGTAESEPDGGAPSSDPSSETP